LFEKFNVRKLYIAMPAVLALYCGGKTTGVILDSGDGVTYTAPVYEGYALPDTIQRIDLAGRDITDHFFSSLKQRILPFLSPQDFSTVREMKESLAYIATDYDQELA
jgi:actin-related protein